MSDLEDLGRRFATYLQAQMPDAEAISVNEIARIHGGASRETFRLVISWTQGNKPQSRSLILRRDPVASLIETDRDLEYNAYKAFHPTGVPVPEPLYLETDLSHLDRPFFVMEAIENATAASPFDPRAYGDKAETVGRQFWTILGEIHAQDPNKLGLDKTMSWVEPKDAARTALEHWAAVIDEDELHAQPIARAAIRWLERNLPTPAERITMVHGDYRTGNFLFDEAGTIKAVLDWEMCHLGDPLEDVAWAADPLWAFSDPNRPGGMIARKEALALWQNASGLTLDPERFRWWEVFASLKGLAIWISAGKEYATGANPDPVLAYSSWYCTDVHNRVLAHRLARIRADERSVKLGEVE